MNLQSRCRAAEWWCCGEVSESKEVGDNLRSTKAAITRWAEITRVDVLDAGRSEDYGCLVSEFMDCTTHCRPATGGS